MESLLVMTGPEQVTMASTTAWEQFFAMCKEWAEEARRRRRNKNETPEPTVPEVTLDKAA